MAVSAIQEVEFVLLGIREFLMHNPRLADPQDSIAQKMKEITTKKNKTIEDHKELEYWDWLGGLYTAMFDGLERVSQPVSKIRKCLINVAKTRKLGKPMMSCLTFYDMNVPLIYEGSEKVKNWDLERERLQNSPEFSSRMSVLVSTKRIMRVRPQFLPWALIVPAKFNTKVGMNFKHLVDFIDIAGDIERLGDNRANGYGSFYGHVRMVNAKTKAIVPTILGVRDFFESLKESD